MVPVSDTNKTHLEKIGLPPGSLKFTGKKKTENVRVTVIDYHDAEFEENEVLTISKLATYKESATASWINVDGLHDVEILSQIGEIFGIHSLAIEDILNVNHRPKLEEYDDFLFFTMKMLMVGEKNQIEAEQVSMVLGKNWLLTFQEKEGDLFDKVRVRLRDSQAKIRKRGIDYVFYALIDVVVDNYFYVIENIKDAVETLEDKVMINSEKKYLIELQNIRKDLLDFRKALVPLREALIDLRLEKTDLIHSKTAPYINDLYEHTLYLNESTEFLQESLNNVLDTYHSGIANKTNQIMQVLTIYNVIFMPLMFIVGLYGMNFDNMPEIHTKYGYFVVLGIMLIIVLSMLKYFKNKKWL